MTEFFKEEIKNKLIPFEINVDISNLTINQKKVIGLLIEISDIINKLYLYQKNPHNITLLEKFENDNKKDLVELIYLFNGPYNIWTKKSFVKDIDETKYQRKNFFYPEGFTQKDLDAIEQEAKIDILSPYKIIKKDENNKFLTVNYSEEYKFYLEKISKLLYETCNYTENYYLKAYLSTLGNSCLNNDFYESDIRWLQMTDNDIEPLIGPYEFYDDNILGIKTSFTSFIAINNKMLTNRIVQIFDMSLNIFPKIPLIKNYIESINFKKNRLQIVDVIYSGGEGRFPIHSVAFNLPNTKEIKDQFGTKKVIMNNIIEAKFEAIMKKIAFNILGTKDSNKVSYKSYFNHIILHEISHNVCFDKIKDPDGNVQGASYFLKDLFGIIEETKADILGLYLQINLIREAVIFDCNVYETFLTYIISLIRTMRFGKENAHSISSIIQWNILQREKALLIIDDIITIDSKKFETILENYLFIIMNLLVDANYDKTKNFIYSLFFIDEDLDNIINKIKDIEIDIYPIFKTDIEK